MFQKKVTILMILLALFLGAFPVFSQQFMVEANLGLNLFDIVGGKASANWTAPSGYSGSGSYDLTLNMPVMANFGLTAGALLKDIFIGGEFAYYSGSAGGGAISGSLTLSGTPYTVSGSVNGTVDVSYLRIGPVFRYYIPISGKALKLFLAAAVDYESSTWTPPTSSNVSKFTIGMLDLAPMAGISYDITPHIYVAGFARFGYYLTISPATLTSVLVTGDSNSISQSWGPMCLFLSVGYKI